MDFRSHRMAKGGWTAVNTFRKIHSENAKQSKYISVVKTAEELEAEARNAEARMEEDSESDDDNQVQVAQSRSKKDYTIDDIMQLDSKLSLGKKKGQAVPMQTDSKGIKKKEKKKVQAKRSKKIIKF